jgi:hypothetical protein
MNPMSLHRMPFLLPEEVGGEPLALSKQLDHFPNILEQISPMRKLNLHFSKIPRGGQLKTKGIEYRPSDSTILIGRFLR